MLSPIQAKLLCMLNWFHNYCHEHGFTYYIVGGSMLGAIRHKGFIPWDDDIDVVLPRPDYDRLIKQFKDVKDHYILESPYSNHDDYYYAYAKLYDIETTLVECARYKCRRGVYIDVFPLDGVGKTREQVAQNFSKVDRMNMLLMTRTCAVAKRRGIIKNAAIIISSALPKLIINDHRLIMSIDKMASSFGYDDSIYVANLMGSYRRKEVMEKAIFGKPTEYRFESIVVDGVEKYDEFLTHIYGDWRKLPPKEQQHTTHEYIECDLNKSWKLK